MASVHCKLVNYITELFPLLDYKVLKSVNYVCLVYHFIPST